MRNGERGNRIPSEKKVSSRIISYHLTHLFSDLLRDITRPGGKEGVGNVAVHPSLIFHRWKRDTLAVEKG